MLVHGSPKNPISLYLIVIPSQLVRWYYGGGCVSNEAPVENAVTGQRLLQLFAGSLPGTIIKLGWSLLE
jgi:hypothetical protein